MALPAALVEDVFVQNGDECAARLEGCLPDTFEEDAAATVVEAWQDNDDNGSNRVIEPQSIRDEPTLRRHLTASASRRLRILSVPQQYSYGPLSITKSCMQELVKSCNIGPSFVPVILAFGEPPRISEQGYDCFISSIAADGSYAISYLYRFVEYDGAQSKWKFRQAGVYHAYTKSTDSHLWVFLQPHPQSVFDCRVQKIARNADSTEKLLRAPFRLHEVLIDSYLGNWRWYLKEVAEDFRDESDKAFTADIDKTSYNINFDVLQQWRDLADRALPLSALFDSLMRILTGLREIQNVAADSPIEDSFKLHKSLLAGIKSSSDVMQKRIQGVIDLLANTIDIKNQKDSSDLNKHLLNLTLDTVDDSATVRIITVVTLLYLPASFIGTLFGMNLFVFDTPTRQIVVARDLWIYVAIIVPLTLFTFLGWLLLYRRSKKNREKRNQGTVTLSMR